MKRAALVTFLVCACRPGPVFTRGLPPSAFNGLWLAGDAGRPLGIVVYELPDGRAHWSPHGLLIEDTLTYVTHDCRDFEVDPVSGSVSAVSGVRPAGLVVSTSADAGTLVWDVPAVWSERLKLTHRVGFGAPSLDAGIVRNGASLDFALEVTWSEPSTDGGGPIVSDRSTQRMTLTRVLACR